MPGPEMPGPVVAGILAVTSAEDVLRHGFEAAQDRDVPLRVLVAGPAASAAEELHDVFERWAGKHPDVPATVSVRGVLDAVVVLAAAAQEGALLVVAESHDPREEAVVRALRRRIRCPLAIAARRQPALGRPPPPGHDRVGAGRPVSCPG